MRNDERFVFANCRRVVFGFLLPKKVISAPCLRPFTFIKFSFATIDRYEWRSQCEIVFKGVQTNKETCLKPHFGALCIQLTWNSRRNRKDMQFNYAIRNLSGLESPLVVDLKGLGAQKRDYLALDIHHASVGESFVSHFLHSPLIRQFISGHRIWSCR